MYTVRLIVENRALIGEVFIGLDISNINDRKRAFKKLPKSFQLDVDVSTFASVVHIVMATLDAAGVSNLASVNPVTTVDSVNPQASVSPLASVSPVTTLESVNPQASVNPLASVNPQASVSPVIVSPVTTEKNILGITKKPLDIVTVVTDNATHKQKQIELWGNTTVDALEARVLALELAIEKTMPRSTLNKVKITAPRDPGAPGNYKGYTVNYVGGKYRLVKRVNGKLQAIYVSTVWSADKADAALLRKGITV